MQEQKMTPILSRFRQISYRQRKTTSVRNGKQALRKGRIKDALHKSPAFRAYETAPIFARVRNITQMILP